MTDQPACSMSPTKVKLRRLRDDLASFNDLVRVFFEPLFDDDIDFHDVVRYVIQMLALLCAAALSTHYYHNWFRPNADLMHAVWWATMLSIVALALGAVAVRLARRGITPVTFYAWILLMCCAVSFVPPGNMLHVFRLAIAAFFCDGDRARSG